MGGSVAACIHWKARQAPTTRRSCTHIRIAAALRLPPAPLALSLDPFISRKMKPTPRKQHRQRGGGGILEKDDEEAHKVTESFCWLNSQLVQSLAGYRPDRSSTHSHLVSRLEISQKK
eukprot:GHVU01049359.1.p2 GENE.GHVU01049359.1~~GHVU01049359.1.p2  ORF type:complete len:118 (-),score=17.44 GHVU01049359.1:580-933(-)